MRKNTPLVAATLVVGLMLLAFTDRDDESTSAASSSSTPAAPTTTSAAPYSYAPAPATADPIAAAPAFAGEPVTVTEVVDGDTFKISDGREIRVLGIDSCEADTYGGGLASSDARIKLIGTYGGTVTITRQTGVDTDRYGRHLRYVQFGNNHEDFGEFMVRSDHTGVYQGRHDASPDYVARLYALDTEYSANPPSGRECSDPTPAAPTSSGNSYTYDGDDDYNMPDGALTGGYCARKWWC